MLEGTCYALFPSTCFQVIGDNVLGWMGLMDLMCLFFHAYSFSEMVVEREVKLRCICAPGGFGVIHLILMGFGPIPAYLLYATQL